MIPNLSALNTSGGALPPLPNDLAENIASDVMKELLIDVSIVPFAFNPVQNAFHQHFDRGKPPTDDQVNAIRCEVRPNYESILHVVPKVHTLEEKGTLGYLDTDYLLSVLEDVSEELAYKIAEEVTSQIKAKKTQRVAELEQSIKDPTYFGMETAREQLQKLLAQPNSEPIKHHNEIIYTDIPYRAVEGLEDGGMPNYTNPGQPAYAMTGLPHRISDDGPWKNPAQSPAWRYDVTVAQSGGEEGTGAEEQERMIADVTFGTIEKDTAIKIADNILNNKPLLQWAEEAYNRSRQNWQAIQNESKDNFELRRTDTDPHEANKMHPPVYGWSDNLPNGRQLFTHRLGANFDLPRYIKRGIVQKYLSGEREAGALVPQSSGERGSNGQKTRRVGVPESSN